MITFSEEGACQKPKKKKKKRGRKGQRARPPVPSSHIVSAKEKFLKEIKSATSVNTGMIRK